MAEQKGQLLLEGSELGRLLLVFSFSECHQLIVKFLLLRIQRALFGISRLI